jgi:CTP synthase (UTP-ammonia lyase)
MSIEQPVHLADFDYNDAAKAKEYALVMKRMKEVDAAWSVIETKALALAAITDAAELTAAIAELEALRNAAYPKLEKFEAAQAVLLPDPVPRTEPADSTEAPQ